MPHGDAVKQGIVNLAPVEPLARLRDSRDPSSYSNLHQLILEMTADVRSRNIDERRQIAETARVIANCRSGKMTLTRDPVRGGYALLASLPRRPGRRHRVNPLFQVNSSQLTSTWSLSNPKAAVRHFGDTNRAQIQHAFIQQIIDHHERDNFDEYFNQRQSLSMMDYGTDAIRIFYDDKYNAIKELRPIVENELQTVFDGYGYCLSCGYEGTDDDFPVGEAGMPECRECGNTNVSDLVPKQTAEVANIVGVEEVRQGNIRAELLPIPALNWDMRGLIHDSSYLTIDTECSTRLVESLLGAEVGDASPLNHEGLNILNEIGSRGGAVPGWGRENLYGNVDRKDGVTIMHEAFFRPEWYAGITLPKDEQTVSGEVIPGNVPLEQVFTKGMAVSAFQDYQILFHVANEEPHVIGSVYHIQSHSGVGNGVASAVEPSEDLSRSHSAAMAILDRYGAGGGFQYDESVMSRTKAQSLLKPGSLVGIKLKGTGYTNINQAIQQINNGTLDQGNLAMIAQLANLMNVAFQQTGFTEGVANENVDVNTLGGQQMLAAQNAQRSAAPLRMKGWSRALCGEHFVGLFREYIKIPVWFSTGDKYSLTKGRYVKGDDLPDRIKCDFVNDSEQPTNIFVQRQNAEQMLEKSQYLGVPFAQLMVTDPRTAAWWADLFRVELPLLSYQEMLIVCQNRLDALDPLVQAAEEIMQATGFIPPLPMLVEGIVDELDQSLKLKLDEENHIVKAQILGGYLDDEEVDNWSPLKLACVEGMIQKHYVLQAEFMLRPQMLQQLASIELQKKAQEAMQPYLDQQNQQAMLTEGLGRAADLIGAEEEHARNEEAAENQFAREQQAQTAQFDRETRRDNLARADEHENTKEVAAMQIKARAATPTTKKKGEK